MRPYLNSTTTKLPSSATSPYLPFCHHSHFLSPKTSPFIPLFQSTRYSPLQNPKLPSYHHQYPTNSLAFGSLVKASMASSASSTETAAETKPFSVLFVCLGNICRSPAAEGVFRDIVKKKALDSKFNIDSAGTINYHEGNMADPRMRAASKRRGIEITSISRPIYPSDFRDFVLFLQWTSKIEIEFMDWMFTLASVKSYSLEDILEAFNRWKFRDPLPADAHKKVRLMCSYCKKHDETEVPDPYYGGPQGFEKVLDLLEDACESLLDNILAENSNIHSS